MKNAKGSENIACERKPSTRRAEASKKALAGSSGPYAPTARFARTIGIVTGSGPEAGLDLWRKIVQAARTHSGLNYRGDIDAPRVMIESVPELGLSMDLQRWQSEVWDALRLTVTRLLPRVDVLCIACNTLHHFEHDLAGLLGSTELVSFPETAAQLVRQRCGRSLGLFAVRPVLEPGPFSAYRRLPEWEHFELPRDLDEAHALVENIKARGPDDADVHANFIRLCAGFESSAIVLACTELPLIRVKVPGKTLIDLTDLVARRAVDSALFGSAECST